MPNFWENQVDYLIKQLKEVKDIARFYQDEANAYQDETEAYCSKYIKARKQCLAAQEGRKIWRDTAKEVLNEEEKKDNEIAHLEDVLRRVHAVIKDGTDVRVKTALNLIESCIDIDE